MNGKAEDIFRVSGFADFSGQYKAEPLDGRLGYQCPLETHDGPRVSLWKLWITGETPLAPGYSGSPVLCIHSGHVLGVTTHLEYQGERGYAIDIASLRQLWKDMPVDVFVQTDHSWGLRDSLKAILRDIEQDATDKFVNWLKLFCHRALPQGALTAVPASYGIYELADWLVHWGKLPGNDNWVPAISVARQLMKHVPECKGRLHRWVDQAAHHFEVDDVWEQPQIIAEPDACEAPALLVELIDLISSNAKHHEVRVSIHDVGRAFNVYMRGNQEGKGLEGLDISQAKQGNVLAQELKRLLADYPIDKNKVVLEFIVPDSLLGQSPEHWRFTDGDDSIPLGAYYPVVVRSARRHYSKVDEELRNDWLNAWQRQQIQQDQRLDAHWMWLAENKIKLLPLKQKKGVVSVALAFVPDFSQQQDFFERLIRTGIAAAFWTRRCADMSAFEQEVTKQLADKPLKDLPSAICEMRGEIWSDDEQDKDQACYHLSLLWDDPHRLLPGVLRQADDEYLSGPD